MAEDEIVIGAPSGFVKAPRLTEFDKWKSVFERYKSVPDWIRQVINESNKYFEEYEGELVEEFKVFQDAVGRYSAISASRARQSVSSSSVRKSRPSSPASQTRISRPGAVPVSKGKARPAPRRREFALELAKRHLLGLQSDISYMSKYNFDKLIALGNKVGALFTKGYADGQPAANTICFVFNFARWLAEICYLECAYLHFHKLSESRDDIKANLQTEARTDAQVEELIHFITTIPDLKSDGGVKTLMRSCDSLLNDSVQKYT